MKTVGIVAEYNPFHNGHKYHIEKAKEMTSAGVCMVVMSGDFTQRGEAAISDKWSRANAAVRGGANLVMELPFVFACNRAPAFARGGVDILVKAGADFIAFGCECSEPRKLQDAAFAMAQKEAEINQRAGTVMKSGCSYAASRETAVREILGDETADIIRTPNNILGIEYLRRIDFWRNKGVKIEGAAIPRKGSGYFGIEDLGEKGFAGASQIREMIMKGEDISPFVPEIIRGGNQAKLKEEMFLMLRGIVIRSTPDDLRSIYSVGEGIENRIIKEIRTSSGYDDLVKRLVSRRYTASAVKRMLTYIIAGVKGNDIDKMLSLDINGARILAADTEGRRHIRQIEDTRFSFVSNVNSYLRDPKAGNDIFRLDAKAADIYNHLWDRDIYGESDFVRKPAIIP